MKELLKRFLRNRQAWVDVAPASEIPIWHEPLDSSFDKGFIHSIKIFKNTVVWPAESVCGNKQGKLINSAFDSRWIDQIDPYLFNYPVVSMKGVCTSFDFLWSKNNHYHQLIDCHSRLFSLVQNTSIKDVKLLLPHDWTDRYVELIQLLFPEITPIKVSPYRRFRCETYLHLPPLSIPRIGGQNVSLGKFSSLSASYFEFHRSVLASSRPPVNAPRIFISRRNASKRMILNRSSLAELLKRLGVVEVFPEKLSVIEQITLFAQAEIVVAPHGAAMSNLIASGPKTTYIELMPCSLESAPNYFGNMGESMFKVIRIPGNAKGIHDDFSVDLDQVAAVFADGWGLS